MKKKNQSEIKPIGVFDSGLGGLTVYRELKRTFPNERFIYIGDTARVPYGNKSPETIRRYSFEIAYFLALKGVKLMVVACNTASSIVLTDLQEAFRFPVVGVVQAGAELVSKLPDQKHVAVIGTRRTVKSGLYQKLISGMMPGIKITAVACPLLVPVIEEGLSGTVILKDALEHYLSDLKRDPADSLLLGCTHYPLIQKQIDSYLQGKTRIINSGKAVALSVKEILMEKSVSVPEGEDEFYLTDRQENFQKIARDFLGFSIPKVKIIPNSMI